MALTVVLAAGCGGGSSGPLAPAPNPSSNPGTPTTGNITAPVQTMRVVSVGPSQAVSGIDINLASPANATGPNAELLGTSELNTGATATNSGATIRRGSTMNVIFFGRALSGSLQVTIGGPPDITVSNIRSITSTGGTPGVAFDASVSAGAALGGRTVYLRSANDDISAFTGGLEVIP